jgi:hydrogenase nickel incorporation protein HypA/HybF
MQRYFDYLSRQTLAEGAKLVIERAPIVLRCESCSRSFEVTREGLKEVQCPDCGESRCRFVSGREYLVKSIEVV